MATLRKEAVRAIIVVGGLTVSTPDVVSFNVTRSRKQMAATFSASLKIDYRDISTIVGSDVSIAAGRDGISRNIFTGIVEKATINPIRSDASKIMLNISGRDVLMKLEGKNITRRASNTNLPLFGVVNSVTRHDVQKIQKFPTRVYTNQKQVFVGMGDFPTVNVPDAFDSSSLLDRARSPKSIGSLNIEKVNKDTTPDSQNSGG